MNLSLVMLQTLSRPFRKPTSVPRRYYLRSWYFVYEFSSMDHRPLECEVRRIRRNRFLLSNFRALLGHCYGCNRAPRLGSPRIVSLDRPPRSSGSFDAENLTTELSCDQLSSIKPHDILKGRTE